MKLPPGILMVHRALDGTSIGSIGSAALVVEVPNLQCEGNCMCMYMQGDCSVTPQPPLELG